MSMPRGSFPHAGFLSDGGEMGERIRAFDWSLTPLGPIEDWPQPLRTATAILLRSQVPIVMLWGEDGIMIYNDAYSLFAGGRHPRLLGAKVREGWDEVADFNDNVMKVGLSGGTLAYRDQELTLYRHGGAEQVFMNLDYSPVLDEAGRPVGVFCIVVETTERVAAERRQAAAEAAVRGNEARLRFLNQLAVSTQPLTDPADVLAVTTRLLGEHLDADICAYADMDLDQDGFTIRGDWTKPTSRSIVGHYSLTTFGAKAVEELHAGRPLVTRDAIAELGAEQAAMFTKIGIAATICMPLVKDGRLTALMAVHSAAPRNWTDAELALITEVTERSWAHIERTRSGQALRGANDTLATLNRTGAAIAGELDLERVVQMVTDAGVELTGARFGAFFYNVLNDAGESYMLYTLSGADRSQFDFGMPRATAVFKPTFDGDGVIRSDDIMADPRYGLSAPHHGMPKGHLPVRSYLAVPVQSRSGEVIGGLFFGHPQCGRFDERHEQLMVGIAAQAAVAIDNARLYQSAQREIEQRRRAEQALLDSESRLRAITNSIDQMIWSTRPDGYHDYFNHRWYEYTGAPEGSTDGAYWNDLFHPEDQDHAWTLWRRSLETGEPYHIEYRLRHRTGEYRWVLGRAQPVRDKSGKIVRWYGTCTDIHDLKKAEAALREGEERLRIALSAGRLGAWSWDTATDEVILSDAAAAIFGVSADQPITWTDMQRRLLHPDDAPIAAAAVERALADGGDYRAEYRHRVNGGLSWLASHGRLTFDRDGRPTGMIGMVQDITERKKAEAALRELNATLEQRVADAITEREKVEEALRQSQKMEAVGQLTGGIAHDFNNLLTVVTGNIDMGVRALEAAGVADARARRAFDNAMKGAERAASLTQRLLAFARRQPLAPRALDVDKLVLGMSDLLNRAIGETVKLEIVTSPGLWRVEADPNQLESAILNLAVNARDAMPEGGELVIETANARLDEEYCASHAEVSPGQYVVIAVTDTGMGMPRDVLDKVFEPFFTTKEVGKGTGLGLSMVYGFVKQSGGHVKIYSEVGQGTTIKIYLPRLLRDSGAEEEAHLTPGIEMSQRAETILVVEDDDDVRAYTVESLRELGYRVIEAHDGTSALRLLDRQDQPVDLLFTDVVMPGMSGRELADAARARHPGLRVLYTSGYTRNAIVHGGRLDQGVEMIAKPFTYAALAQKVRDMLDAGRTGRILVVEDEPTVRTLAVEALTASGYAVEEAATAAEALGKIRSAQGRYDAVFVDHDLPDQPGDTLAAELRALHADLPILLTSAEHEEALRRRFANERCTAVIGKPYRAAQLTEALQRLGLRCASAVES